MNTIQSRAPGGAVRHRTGLLPTLVAVLSVIAMSLLVVQAPAQAADPARVALSKRVGVTDGEVVSATLTNFPASSVLVRQCVVSGQRLDLGDCTSGTPVTVPDAGGGQGQEVTTSVTVAKMVGANDCSQVMCAITTATDGATPDPAAVTKTTIAFATPSMTITSGPVPVAAVAHQVTVRGTGFRPGLTVRLTECESAPNTNCRSTLGSGYAEPTTDSAGSFTATINVDATWAAGATTVKCWEITTCTLATSSKAAGADATQQAAAPLVFASAAMSATKTTGLNPAGESITVTGTNYKPGVGLYLLNCLASDTSGGTCDMANSKQVTVGADGTFSQALTVASFPGTDCLTKACAVMTSRVGQGADLTQQRLLPLSFSTPVVKTAKLSADRTAGLNPAGDTINVTGTGFAPGVTLFLVNCLASDTTGATCDMANLKQVTVDASGGFTQALKVGSFQGTDCLVVACAVMTSRVGQGADLTQQTALPLTFTAVTTPPPGPTGPQLTASRSTDLNPAGDDITVKGSGFKAATGLFVVLCDPAVPNGGACDMANFKQVKTDAAGAFSTPLHVVAKFGTTDCTKVACALMTSRIGAGADRTQEAKLAVTFGDGSTTPPAAKAKVSLSKSKNLPRSSKVKVKASGFRAGESIAVAQCLTKGKAGKVCAKPVTRKASSTGSFSAKLKVTSVLKSGKRSINCAKVSCSVRTWSTAKKADRSQQVKVKLSFGRKNGRWAGASLSVSKTSGLAAAGEKVSVNGSGFQPNIGLYVVLCNTAVPAGGACDMANLYQAQTDGSGGFSGTLNLRQKFSTAAGEVDCASDPCAVSTSKIGDGGDRTQEATVKVSFGGQTGGNNNGGGNDNGGNGGGDNGGNAGSSGSSGGGSTGTTATETSTSPSTGSVAVLPATGASFSQGAALLGMALLLLGSATFLAGRWRVTLT